MVEVVAERGFARATVKSVTARAGVSSRTFYERFDGLEDCFAAVIDLGVERARGLIMEAFAREDDWRDGVRAALASLLVFFDSEPLLARAIKAADPGSAPARAAVKRAAAQDAVLSAAPPAMLDAPGGRRARECMLFLAEHRDSSNREIAVGIGIVHPPQISRLLADLLEKGLVVKRSEGAGKRNAWRLTPRGEEIARAPSE